jgi:hypothetical protein
MSNLPDLLNGITKHKRSQAELLRYLKPVDLQLHDKLRWCGSWLLIREFIESGETRLRNANFCKRGTICPACAVRRGAKLTQAALPKIQSVISERPELKLIHVTLTVENNDSLVDGLAQIKEAWTRMVAHRRKALSGSQRHSSIEWNKVEGGVRSFEVTNKGKGWHPHIHVLAICSDWIDREKLSQEFERFGGGKIVWATKVGSEEQELIPALLEVLKYPTKFGDLTSEQRYHFYYASRSSRMTDTFGCLRGIKIGDLDQDDMEGLDGEYVDWIAKWIYSSERFYVIKSDEEDERIRDRVASFLLRRKRKNLVSSGTE